MKNYLLEILECPDCHGTLEWNITDNAGDRILEAAASCEACPASYSVREGIGIFLTPDLPRNDLWENVDNRLFEFLEIHPEIEKALMENPLEALSPVDQHYRAVVLEQMGRYDEAEEVFRKAKEGLYTADSIRYLESQLDYVIEELAETDGPVVDLASGAGKLANGIVKNLEIPLVVTDFSPSILRKNRLWLKRNGCYDSISLLSFDARKTPFKDGSIGTMTTCMGLPNIEEPGVLLEELRRIVSGRFLAISHFYPEDDEVNGKIIREAGLEKLLYRSSALNEFKKAGWNTAVENSCTGEDRPSPPGIILEGARVDALPACRTDLEWCVISAV